MSKRLIAMLTNNIGRDCMKENEEEQRIPQVDPLKAHKTDGTFGGFRLSV